MTSVECVYYFQRMIRKKKWISSKYSKGFILNWKEVMQVPPEKSLLLGFLPTKPFAFEDNSSSEENNNDKKD